MSDDTKHAQEVNVLRNAQPTAKRTAKNSVFLDLFQNKSYLLKLYKTLHPCQLDGKYFNQNTVVFGTKLS